MSDTTTNKCALCGHRVPDLHVFDGRSLCRLCQRSEVIQGTMRRNVELQAEVDRLKAEVARLTREHGTKPCGECAS